MTNNAFKQFRQQTQPAQKPDINALFNQFQQDPVRGLQNYNIPDDIKNDPRAILSHLLQSGQVTQAQFASARQMYGRLFGKRL